MKSANEASLKRLPVAQGSADELNDFLYVDRARVSALYAQLFPQGILTSVKTTAQEGFADDRNFGSDVKILKAEAKSTESGMQGIEHVFDASWSVPLDVLAELEKRGRIATSVLATEGVFVNLGTLVLMSGFLRMIDYSSVKELWEPAVKLFVGKAEVPNLDNLIALLKNLPHTLHAHFISETWALWGSLSPDNLAVPTADILLKHGARPISGKWNMLFAVDAYPEYAAVEVNDWGAGEATKGILQMIEAFRLNIGRPLTWFGVTPIMIFRSISDITGNLSAPDS